MWTEIEVGVGRVSPRVLFRHAPGVLAKHRSAHEESPWMVRRETTGGVKNAQGGKNDHGRCEKCPWTV